MKNYIGTTRLSNEPNIEEVIEGVVYTIALFAITVIISLIV